MFLRLLFTLLLALNLGVAAWLLFGDDSPPMPAATKPGVPLLHLLSERSGDASTQSAELSEAPQRASASDQCFSLGAFPTQADVRTALDALTPQVSRIQFRQEYSTASRGWWVYLPALPSRDRALEVARSLSDHGVRDYYVVTAGDRQNTISLGLFHNRSNAERRQTRILGLGLKPELTERTEQVPKYYVDYALARGKTLDWTKWIEPRPHLSVKPMACF